MMATITITTAVDMTAITVAGTETDMAVPGADTVAPIWAAGAAWDDHDPVTVTARSAG
ncbi:hypothetical protein AA18890_0747 [Komagataeibacter europaeus LMG 18890]|nr:hypothetical protein AA18890_0747 [Komagataeibacter europaeus LMG 18890]